MRAIANKTVVPIFNIPDCNSSLSDELLYGMSVTILEPKVPIPDQWLYIMTDYRYLGYVCKEDFILENCRKLYCMWEQGHKRRVMKAHADVLSEPRVQGVILMEITRGGLISQIKACEADKSDWIKVKLVDGRTGYMKESFLEEPRTVQDIPDEELRQRVVDTAKMYLGTQYRWGGKSPLGIDCSGLTSISYLINGILTYRDAKLVEGFPVHEISFEDRKAGDLLYFKGHIAMLIDKRRYIHSTAKAGSDGVVYNSLMEEDEDYREDLAKGILAVGSVFPLNYSKK